MTLSPNADSVTGRRHHVRKMPRHRRHLGGVPSPMCQRKLLGGVVGNQVGDGFGKDAATVAGAIAGNKVQENMQQYDVRQEVKRVRELPKVSTREFCKPAFRLAYFLHNSLSPALPCLFRNLKAE